MQQDHRPPPCLGDPRFVQHGDDPGWSTHPDTLDARDICLTLCPLAALAECARAAQFSGRPLDDDTTHTYPADGVVAAGVICTGDDATIQALRDAESGGRTTAPRCTRCARTLVSGRTPREGEARNCSGGLCSGCYSALRRAGKTKPRFRPPSTCIACAEPMVTSSTPATDRPAAYVIHHSHGQCRACAAASHRIVLAAATA
ncbi:hypothetical protein [Nocardia asteroides]|uniref:hypothetical protein n=1 Tax=Nocardia asteroides TaxID=1824 RepID=UPI0033C88C91